MLRRSPDPVNAVGIGQNQGWGRTVKVRFTGLRDFFTAGPRVALAPQLVDPAVGYGRKTGHPTLGPRGSQDLQEGSMKRDDTAMQQPMTEVIVGTGFGGIGIAVPFLHGGAFIIGSRHRRITGGKLTGAAVFVPDYRLAPKHPFPAALDDVLAWCRDLLKQGYAPGADRSRGGLGL
jgi:hypothetical protein